MIVPFWLIDGTESALWTSQTAMVTALTGDPWASSWMVYCADGIASHKFDLSPVSAEIRTLVDCYRLVGQECEDDPDGGRATHSLPNSQGNATVITTGRGPNKVGTHISPSPQLIRYMGIRFLAPRVCPLGCNPRRRRR